MKVLDQTLPWAQIYIHQTHWAFASYSGLPLDFLLQELVINWQTPFFAGSGD